jgi:hypothetical protein
LQIVPLNEALDNTNYKLKRMTPRDMSRIPMTLLRVKDSLKTRYERIGMQIYVSEFRAKKSFISRPFIA